MVREEQELVPRAAPVQECLQVVLHRRHLGPGARDVIRVHQPLLLHVHLTVAAAVAQCQPVRLGAVPQLLQLLLDPFELPVRVRLFIQRDVHLLPSLRRELRQDVALQPAHHDQPGDDRVELVGVLATLPPEPRSLCTKQAVSLTLNEKKKKKNLTEQYLCANSLNLGNTFGRSASTCE